MVSIASAHAACNGLARKNFRFNKTSCPLYFEVQNNQGEAGIMTLMTDILGLVVDNLWHLFHLSSGLNKTEKNTSSIVDSGSLARVHFTLKLYPNQPEGCHVSFPFYTFFLYFFYSFIYFCHYLIVHFLSTKLPFPRVPILFFPVASFRFLQLTLNAAKSILVEFTSRKIRLTKKKNFICYWNRIKLQ